MASKSTHNIPNVRGRKLSTVVSSFLSTLNRRRCKSATRLNFKEELRVSVYGSAKVGKTTIIKQFLHDELVLKYHPTIYDVYSAEYNLSDGAYLKLKILDTDGNNAFPSVRKVSIKHTDAFVLVFSTHSWSSWEEVKTNVEQIWEICGNLPIVVVATNFNKKNRVVEREMVESQIARWNCGYVECNAHENTNIVAIFKEVLYQSNIDYDLNEAVSRRRKSIPVMPCKVKPRSRSGSKIN